MRWATSLPPTTITATSAEHPGGRPASWVRSLETSEPTIAAVWNLTARRVRRASRLASCAPEVCLGFASEPGGDRVSEEEQLEGIAVLRLVGAVC
jgi:flavin reductase (DIM6/NTAB) family NADH-FMN oxidoreductase RutF